MLCDVCLGVLERHENEFKELRRDAFRKFGHHRSFMALKAAATSGCYLCCLVGRNMSEGSQDTSKVPHVQDFAGFQSSQATTPTADSDQLNDENFFTYAIFEFNSFRDRYAPKELYFDVQVGEQSGPTMVNHFYLERMRDNGRDLKPAVHIGISSQDTLSERALQHAMDWLSVCRQSHTVCNNTASVADWFPNIPPCVPENPASRKPSYPQPHNDVNICQEALKLSEYTLQTSALASKALLLLLSSVTSRIPYLDVNVQNSLSSVSLRRAL